MEERTYDGFYYGLFMDADVLTGLGVAPRQPHRAYVENYRLIIGNRATLWPASGERVYGVIYSLTRAEIDTLYSGTGLATYLPEAVSAITIEGGMSDACLCFNLPYRPAAGENNPEYAARLRVALTQLEFPRSYIDSIK